MTVPCERRMNPHTVVAYSLGILLFFYSGKSPTRLFVVLSVTVKPFDDVVAGYTSRNSDDKRYDKLHVNTSSRCRCRLDNTRIITYQLIFFYPFLEMLYGLDCG